MSSNTQKAVDEIVEELAEYVKTVEEKFKSQHKHNGFRDLNYNLSQEIIREKKGFTPFKKDNSDSEFKPDSKIKIEDLHSESSKENIEE